MTSFIKDAIVVAKKSPANKSKHGAVLFSGGKKIYEAFNTEFITDHAEALTILGAASRLKSFKRMKLVVVRISRCGYLMESKPCMFCLKLLRKFNIKRVYYSTSTGEIVKNTPNCIIDSTKSKGFSNFPETDTYIKKFHFRLLKRTFINNT